MTNSLYQSQKMKSNSDLLSIKEASRWASHYLGKWVTPSNISYLINYGRICNQGADSVFILKEELKNYYDEEQSKVEKWKSQLGDDLNWDLSFDQYKESERTKHVHRLHPYKGKFIPQLVSYFLDNHTDCHKKEIFFRKGSVVLDPFCGSGTTLVEANELGIHAIGLDISRFNSLIANVKIKSHCLTKIAKVVCDIEDKVRQYELSSSWSVFDRELSSRLSLFNATHFPSPEFKIRARRKDINELHYSREREKEFSIQFNQLVEKHHISFLPFSDKRFLDKWFLPPIRDSIKLIHDQVLGLDDEDVREVLMVILSRVMRSCRATTHADLATLKEPVRFPYYCRKHGKICKPLFSVYGWWRRYGYDTIRRLETFSTLRTNSHQICLEGDARACDMMQQLQEKNNFLYSLIKERSIQGIFTSPPYIGLINYHEQHAYAYDLFELERCDELEIGSLHKGQGNEAKKNYISAIVSVLRHCRQYLVENAPVFLVANDKYNLYPTIAEQSGMMIKERYKRPVLNRTEKDKGAYAETIFHFVRHSS